MRRTARHRRGFRPSVDRLDGRWLPSALTPVQVRKAYGLDAVAFTVNGQTIQGDGTGQTIALVEAYHDPYLAADLDMFNRTYGLPPASLTVVNLAGGQTDDGWAGEAALDVEWAHAIAPGAKLVVVEARSSNDVDMRAAVDTARRMDGVTVVSMSWGAQESSSDPSHDNLFTTPAGHVGVTFLASSGDDGAAAGAQWPSSSPNVIGVGGTTLRITSTNDYQSESPWSGSGGGPSRYQPEPSYQMGFQSTGKRTTPDVSFVGDPRTGVSVYGTAPSTGHGAWWQVGGTSLGAPAWAGIVAIIDQGRGTIGKGSLDGATEALPMLYKLQSSDFHAMVANGSTGLTGLGSPVGGSLIVDMVYGTNQTGGGGGGGSTGGGGGSTGGGGVGFGVPIPPITVRPPSPILVPVPTAPGGGSGGSGSSGGVPISIIDPTPPATPAPAASPTANTTPTKTTHKKPHKPAKAKKHAPAKAKAKTKLAHKATAHRGPAGPLALFEPA